MVCANAPIQARAHRFGKSECRLRMHSGKNQIDQRIKEILLADTAHATTARLGVVGHTQVTATVIAIEVQAVRVVSIVLRSRPIVAAGTGIRQPTIVAEPDSGKLH